MSYKIGQFTRGRLSGNNFISLIDTGIVNNVIMVGDNNAKTYDCYYLEFTASTDISKEVSVVILNNAILQQTVRKFYMYPEERKYTLVFSVKFDGLTQIMINGVASLTNVKLYKISNLLLDTVNIFEATSLTKIEINGLNGQIFCINGEEIRLGRRNIFTLAEKNIKITNFGFVPIKDDGTINNDISDSYFTLVYEYKEEISE